MTQELPLLKRIRCIVSPKIELRGPVSSSDRVISICIGVAGIVWAFIPGVGFYPGGFGIVNRTKSIPKWRGRFWFIIIGLVFIYFGLRR